MSCGEGFAAEGEVRLTGAHIGGQVSLNGGAKLTNPGAWALVADGLTADQGMSCAEGFAAEGEVRLAGARIGGQLILRKASVTNPGAFALTADRLTVGLGMFIQEGFAAEGEVRLPGADISGQLVLDGVGLTNPGGNALNMEGASAADLVLLPKQTPDGFVLLTNAHVGAFLDDQATWPATLFLRGFTYDSLQNVRVRVRDRLSWLSRHPERYAPQIYDQLAAVYRRAGNEQAARKVAIAKQRHRRSRLSPLNWLWYLTVGYGYRTWWAALWLAVLVIIGTIVFSRAYPAHMIAISAHPPAFHALGYALNVLLPVVDLGEKSAWQPQGSALYWSWALTIAGWTLTTAVVAGLTGVLKRD